MRTFTRRQFLGSIALAGIGGSTYVRALEPGWLEVHTVQAAIGLGRPLRLLHLADFHAASDASFELIQQAIELGVAQEPDLICVTGDFINDQLTQRERYVQLLQRLSTTAPTFACLGNHDGGAWAVHHRGYADGDAVHTLLRDAGLTALDNEALSVELEGQVLHLVGLGDLWADTMRPEDAFRGLLKKEKEQPCIVLAHNPDSKEALSDFAWDLMLCGHTHGGQLKLPIIGTPFAPVRDHRYVEGLRTWNDRLIHVTRGVGSLYGVRFNCRPQVSIVELS